MILNTRWPQFQHFQFTKPDNPFLRHSKRIPSQIINGTIRSSMMYFSQFLPSMWTCRTKYTITRHLRPLRPNSVLTHQGQSGGRSAGRNVTYYFNFSCYVVYTHTHLFVSFIDRHISMLTIASYRQPRWDK